MQDILTRVPPPAHRRLAYGQDANHFGDLRLPVGSGPHPLAINIHGGFWRAAYNLEHNGHLCEALRAKGVATWSIEYRRLGQAGGGWPGTLHDVLAAAEHVYELARDYPLDLDRVIAMGHSAGGHLALYLGAELPWLRGVVSLAGVADLRHALDLKLSREVVKDFLGGTYVEVPDRYRHASPVERLPLRRPVVLIQGKDDDIVPPAIAERYAAAAREQNDPVRLELLAGGHFELIDPASPQWATVERSVLAMLRIS